MSIYDNILTKGIKYSPANTHYPDKPNCIVNCDRCMRNDLDESYGYDNYDLCLTCYTQIKDPIILDLNHMRTQMEQRQFTYDHVVYKSCCNLL